MRQFKPARRTVMVLLVLVGSMTLASGALLRLEPGPTAPGSRVIPPENWPPENWVVAPEAQREQAIITTNPPPASGRWTSIAIHFSGTARGSAESLGALHTRRGLDGLAYHFVIGNGQGSPDGQIEVGYRWANQRRGLASDPQGRAAVIDICLIGDGNRVPPTDAQLRELVWVVQRLQNLCAIPAEQVLLARDPETGRGRLFPVAWFCQQLLARPTP